MPNLYFDNAATTQPKDEVVLAMAEVLKNNFGNASSSHSFGRSSKALIEKSRKTIARQLNVSDGEIIFTSGGTEANNLILRSVVRDLGVKHIITSKIEHHAVLNTIEQLQIEYNIEVSFVALNEFGEVDYSHLEILLGSDQKTLVSLMHINNEIGAILDLQRVSNLCIANKALFHTDAVQSVGHYILDLQEIKVDFLTASAHKFHGPKGVGFLFVRKNSGLKPLVFGGGQERGLRAGTESVHDIVGLETAFKLAYANLEIESTYIKSVKKYFINSIIEKIPQITFNGNSQDLERHSYTIVNVSLPTLKNANTVLFQLDLQGIACSRGSACQSGSNKNSHVLAQILNESDLIKPSMRFSFSVFNTKSDVDFVVDALKNIIN